MPPWGRSHPVLAGRLGSRERAHGGIFISECQLQYKILQGDCVEAMRAMPDNSFDSIVTDPPYELGFMGKGWDSTGIANSVEMWREALRVLKPGGHLLAFSGSRTYHRMTCAIEDAGFEIRDQIMWVYGSGFPKSLDVSKAIDKAAGAEREVVGTKLGLPGYSLAEDKGRSTYSAEGRSSEVECAITAPATDDARQWSGWGTALKPAHEPICVARKPLAGTVAANVLQFGTGAINIDRCRVPTDGADARNWSGDRGQVGTSRNSDFALTAGSAAELGRWPANIIHDGSDEVVAHFPITTSGAVKPGTCAAADENRLTFGQFDGYEMKPREKDTGSAARFFYCAKASKSDRGPGNTHPTVKPLALMRYLLRLVTPPGGRSLDPFMGSGTTIVAGLQEGLSMTGIELHAEHIEIADRRAEIELIGDLL